MTTGILGQARRGGQDSKEPIILQEGTRRGHNNFLMREGGTVSRFPLSGCWAKTFVGKAEAARQIHTHEEEKGSRASSEGGEG